MPFPPSDRVRYERNPLEEVICQLRFPPILAIGTDEPVAFQDSVRDAYPFYKRNEGFGVPAEIRSLMAQLPIPGVGDLVTHRFESDDSRTISLTRTFVAVSFGDSRYAEWASFLEEVERAKAATQQTYQPAFYTRVGLRYRDVIQRSRLELGDVPWTELIRPDLLGALADEAIGLHVKGIKSEVLLDFDEVPGGLVKVQHGLIDRKGADGAVEAVYLLDSDYYVEGRIESSGIRGILDRFNQLAGYFFRWAITPRLTEALRPMAV